jgi:predicted RND superfamily exporter protein
MILMLGFWVGKDLKVGDLDKGAPELRVESRYNLDNAYMTDHYSASSDVLVVMLETPAQGTTEYETVVATARLQWELEKLEGVKSTTTYVDFLKMLNVAYNEGNLKWSAIPRSPSGLNSMAFEAARLLAGNREGKLSPIIVSLADHRAETLGRVVSVVEDFGGKNNSDRHRYLLAAGNAGIEAATNIEIQKGQLLMTVLVYAIVLLTCVITYRSWRAALCIMLPLFVTTILCEALMAVMGIGIKVATLPVIAVGVGIGVDYGIYLYSKMQSYICEGLTLQQAYSETLRSTGQAVLFTGTILAIGVGTWAFSPIKFQADMGILLTFMFVGNMVGALVLMPALAQKLLREPKKA